MRRMSPIIAVLLALAMVIFPISMPQAAALMGGDHTVSSSGAHDHHHASDIVDGCESSASAGCDTHEHDGSGNGAGCCGMGACHVFQASHAPLLYSPMPLLATVAIRHDEQVSERASGRLDRPPRTV